MLAADVLLLPVEPFSKKPLTCHEHLACQAFLHGAQSATRRLDWILAVESLHPGMNIGIVPGPTLLAVDADIYKTGGAESWSLIKESGRIDAEHVVVHTPRGGRHLFLQRSALSDYESLPAVDLRYDENGYVLAPGSVVRDPDTGEFGEYILERGTWGEFEVDRGIEALFLPRSDSRPRERITIQRPAISTDSATDRLLHALEAQHAEYVGSGDPDVRSTWNGAQWLTNRTDHSDSANLCAIWGMAYARGFTPEQAVEVVITYRPALAGSRLDMPRQWLLEDARRVFGKASAPTRTRSSRRDYWTADLNSVSGRLRDVLEYAVEMANTSQSELIYLGTKAVAEQFGVTRSLAGRWLRTLVDLGLLVIEADYRFFEEDDPRNRCRLYSIRNLVIGTTTTAGTTPIVNSKGNLATSSPSNPRVQQVVELTRQGYTNTEIAHEMDISMRTVRRLREQAPLEEPVEADEELPESIDDAFEYVRVRIEEIRSNQYQQEMEKEDGGKSMNTSTKDAQGASGSPRGAQGGPNGSRTSSRTTETLTGRQMGSDGVGAPGGRHG